MDSLGDWLYIIIIIVAGISSLFSSTKKKKRPTEVLGQPDYEEIPEKPTNERSFWEIFEEELKGTPKVESQPAPPPVPVTKRENQFSQKFSVKDVKSNRIPTSPILQETNEDENFLFNEESFHDVDELRKAIIYTEILNRKY